MNLFETQRQLFTDIDFLLKNSSNLLLDNSVKNGIFKDYIISKNLNLLQFKAKKILELENSLEKSQELNNITSTGQDLPEFYSYLKVLRSEYNDSSLCTPLGEEKGDRDWEADRREFESRFNGEEGLGHFLDLVEFYNRFLNLKPKRINYLSYVRVFYDLEKIPLNSKKSADYKSYVKDLCFYMENFISKTNPLTDLDYKKVNFLKKFEKKWENGDFKMEIDDPLFCKACNFLKIIIIIGEKQFSKVTVFEAHKSGKKHLKALESFQNNDKGEKKNLAMFEFLIKEYTVELQNVIEETVFHVERKQTLTEKERVL